MTIAQALGIEDKLNALRAILDGNFTEANLALLDEDWTIEERCQEALHYWKLDALDLMHLKRWRKNKSFSCRNYHSSACIYFAGRAQQPFRYGRQAIAV